MQLVLLRWKHLQTLSTLLLLLVSPVDVSGFVATSRRLLPFGMFMNHRRQRRHQQPPISSSTATNTDSIQCWAKNKKNPRSGAAGGGGFRTKTVSSSSSSSKMNTSADAASLQKTTLQKVKKKYGGTSAQEIAQSTQQQIEMDIQQLPAHLQMAIQIYQQLQKWNAHVSGLSVLEQATILSPAELDGAKRAQDELNRMYQQYDISSHDLHNILQRITWNASADAKAARSVTGSMPTDIATRVDRACEIVADTLREAATTIQSSSLTTKAAQVTARMLDVGCGFGVLVPHLIKAGVQPSQIFGIDLSPEMIRNAQEMHHCKKNGSTFAAVDFLSDDYRGPDNNHDAPPDDAAAAAAAVFDVETGCFDSIIFCSSLHDMPHVVGAIKKAARLLRPAGKLVIVHPQGSSHVLNQVRTNPALVTRGLPDAKELQTLCTATGLELVVEPANAGSKEEALEGYLAVLQKRRIP